MIASHLCDSLPQTGGYAFEIFVLSELTEGGCGESVRCTVEPALGHHGEADLNFFWVETLVLFFLIKMFFLICSLYSILYGVEGNVSDCFYVVSIARQDTFVPVQLLGKLGLVV